jgi:hypothetical protein
MESRMLPRSRWVILVSILALAGVSPAAALEPDDLCVGNPCVVSGSIGIQESVQLDFGDATELRFAMGTRITFQRGQYLQLIAGSIVVEPGVAFRSAKPAGDAEGPSFLRLEATTGDLTIGSAEGRATIEMQDPGPSLMYAQGETLLVSDGGSVWINGRINLNAEDGGSADLVVRARDNTTVRGRITADGARSGQGMDTEAARVILEAVDGTLRVDAAISAKATYGGNIVLLAGQGADLAGVFNTGSRLGCPGDVFVDAGGDVATAARIRSNGGYECCDGGSILIRVKGSVTLAGPMAANAGSSGELCLGGDVFVEAGNDVIQERRGTIAAQL